MNASNIAKLARLKEHLIDGWQVEEEIEAKLKHYTEIEQRFRRRLVCSAIFMFRTFSLSPSLSPSLPVSLFVRRSVCFYVCQIQKVLVLTCFMFSPLLFDEQKASKRKRRGKDISRAVSHSMYYISRIEQKKLAAGDEYRIEETSDDERTNGPSNNEAEESVVDGDESQSGFPSQSQHAVSERAEITSSSRPTDSAVEESRDGTLADSRSNPSDLADGDEMSHRSESVVSMDVDGEDFSANENQVSMFVDFNQRNDENSSDENDDHFFEEEYGEERLTVSNLVVDESMSGFDEEQLRLGFDDSVPSGKDLDDSRYSSFFSLRGDDMDPEF